MEIFNYGFMQRAFLVGLLLAAVIPCIGMVIVCKRLSMIGDALSHTSLAGVAAGLILGMNPVAAAALACITASLGIEIIRRKLPRYSEMSIAIVMSAGVGLAGVLSGFVKNAANFNSFLFGSIVAISDTEMYLVVGVSAAVLLLFLLMYKELFYISLDEQSARAGRGAGEAGKFPVHSFDRSDGFRIGQNRGSADCILYDGGAGGLCHAVWKELPTDYSVGGGPGYDFHDNGAVCRLLPGFKTGRGHRSVRRRLPDTGIYSQKIINDIFEMI